MSNSPKLKIEMLATDSLQEYEGNARQHGEIDIIDRWETLTGRKAERVS